jgi:hypothetical protein
MLRSIVLIGALAILLPAPASAITAKEKMETCKFGADDQKLKGGHRTTFIKRCMADEKTDKPMKPVAQKKPAASVKPAAVEKPADDGAPRFPNVKE